jgi:hypothetical protein
MFLGAVACFGLMQLAVMGALLWFVNMGAALAWGSAVFLCTPAFARIRQTLEHRDLNADPGADYTQKDHGPVHRMFGTSLFARFFGAAGFNRHLLHHYDPTVSFTRFDDMESFLDATPLKDSIDRARTTYAAALKGMLA